MNFKVKNDYLFRRFWFTDIRQRNWDPIPRKGRMETDCRCHISHIERPKGDDDCVEWARRCRNRRRTDLNSIRKCHDEILYDVKDERVKEYTSGDINVSDRRLDRHHLLQHFLKDALFEDDKFIVSQMDTSLYEVSYRNKSYHTVFFFFISKKKRLACTTAVDIPRNAPLSIVLMSFSCKYKYSTEGEAKVREDDGRCEILL